MGENGKITVTGHNSWMRTKMLGRKTRTVIYQIFSTIDGYEQLIEKPKDGMED